MPRFHQVSLIYNLIGQTIEWYPPSSEVVWNGAPAAASYSVFPGTQGLDQPAKFLGTATLDTVATTLGTIAGYSQDDRTLLSLASVVGVAVGRRYLISNAAGQREVVVPASVASGVVFLEEPLAYDYLVGAAFVGLRQSVSVPDAFIQDVANINVWSGYWATTGRTLLTDIGGTNTAAPPFQVRWSYTLSTPRQAWTAFNVERRQAKANLSMEDLRELAPDASFFEWLNQRGQDYTPQLIAAERDVAIDTRVAGYNPDQIVDPQIWNRIVLQKWLVTIGKAMLFSQTGEQPPWLQMVIDDYDKLFQSSVSTSCRAWVDTGSSGAITPNPARQLWLRGR